MPTLSKDLNLNNPNHCEICTKRIDVTQKVVSCCLCKRRVHIKCNKSKLKDIITIDNRYDYPICTDCKENTLPFQKYTQQHTLENNEGQSDIKKFL